MHRFWENIINPCFEQADIKNIVEIGCDLGLNTINLVKYCKKHNGMLSIVDPAPRIDVEKEFEEYADCFRYYKAMSLNVLSNLKGYDAILIDGDHNWYTVYHELKLIEKNMERFPLILFHDISWPYDRRDLYYNVENVPAEFVNPYKKMGINVDTNELTEDGFNGRFDNSIYYHNYRCGVLTAIEDFINESSMDLKFYCLPLFNGLGFLFDINVFSSQKFLNYMDRLAIDTSIQNIMKETDKYYAKAEIRYFNERKNNEQNKKHLKEKQEYINNLENRIKDIQETLLQKQSEYESIKNKCVLHEKDLLHSKNQLQFYKEESQRHVNSIRYQIGSAMIEATSSFRALIRLPKTLIKLYKHRGNNPGSHVTSIKDREDEEEALPPPAKYNKQEIIDINIQRLESNKIKLDENPLVSIIITNRNGLNNLKILFQSLKDNQFYNNFEIILVDNGSTDRSLDFIEKQKQYFNISCIKNEDNKSFSKANNQGSKICKGKYLLFLNNDIEVTKGWLDELLIVAYQNEDAGAIGAKLIYPQIPNDRLNRGKSFYIQHRGIAFKNCRFENERFTRPYNLGNLEEAISEVQETTIQRAAVTAAALLIEKKRFEEVGGFDERYIYGYEDVDLCLKLFRKGYQNYYCPTCLLFHYEFGTQAKSERKDVIARRTNNIHVFRDTWESYLEEKCFKDKLSTEFIFCDEPLTVAFAVTEAHEQATAGDYFTAMEFAASLQKLGYNIKYLCRKGPNDWYQVGEEVDILVSMLDAYDVSKIYDTNSGLITIAWARNWFDRWAHLTYLNAFTYVFASCKSGCEYIERESGRRTILFPIATNAERFILTDLDQKADDDQSRFVSDYVFTGSYWNDPREIIDIIDPESYPYSFKVYGANWNKVDKFAPYYQGFIKYEDIPNVYKYTKIVIDDANRATKEMGAVNSRVYDAIASGRLVLTNGVKGAQETFGGLLPCFSSKNEFRDLLQLYMENPAEREAKIKELRQFVLKNHTYDVRAETLQKILLQNCNKDRKAIAIMVPAPKWSEVEQWGDYHFAIAMKKCFEKEGYTVEIRILPEWDKPFNGLTVIVLRGLSRYIPKNEHINIMWNISHPDEVQIEEYDQYDAVYVASTIWAEHLKPLVSTPVYPLLQCTDPEVFGSVVDEEKKYELLFVGNSRKVFRKVIQDVLPTDYSLSIYGTNWDGFVDPSLIKGINIPNHELAQVYHDCAILLNDHWDDMREKGFISNRIFDGLAAGAFIISDRVAGIDHVLKDCIVMYDDKQDLYEKVKYYMEHEEQRKKISSYGKKVVLEDHTFANRMKEILKFIENKA